MNTIDHSLTCSELRKLLVTEMNSKKPDQARIHALNERIHAMENHANNIPSITLDATLGPAVPMENCKAM